jgi:hypothetical protein
MRKVAANASRLKEEKALQELPRVGLFLGEQDAISRMLQDAEKFGYGNFIARLREAWIDRLVEREGICEATATLAAFTSPRPRKDRGK